MPGSPDTSSPWRGPASAQSEALAQAIALPLATHIAGGSGRRELARHRHRGGTRPADCQLSS